MSNVKLNNVRIAFPSLFSRAVYEGKAGKYEATLLISKESQQPLIEVVTEAIKAAVLESGIKVHKDKYCLRDGDDTMYDYSQDCYSLKGSNNSAPIVINRDKTRLNESESSIIYGGCYVNAIVSFWVQNNAYGKRVNCNLLGVQFVADGESFNQSPSLDVNEFDAVDDIFV